MGACYVQVDEGMDIASYTTKEPPHYLFVPIPASKEGEEDGRIVMCCFVPQNGHARGKLLQVPMARIISVAENRP